MMMLSDYIHQLEGADNAEFLTAAGGDGADCGGFCRGRRFGGPACLRPDMPRLRAATGPALAATADSGPGASAGAAAATAATGAAAAAGAATAITAAAAGAAIPRA